MYNFLNGKKGNVKYYQRLMLVILLAGMWLIGFSSDVPAVDTEDTRMLTRPAISKTHIAFVYAGYLWSADREGKNVRRLPPSLQKVWECSYPTVPGLLSHRMVL